MFNCMYYSYPQKNTKCKQNYKKLLQLEGVRNTLNIFELWYIDVDLYRLYNNFGESRNSYSQ